MVTTRPSRSTRTASEPELIVATIASAPFRVRLDYQLTLTPSSAPVQSAVRAHAVAVRAAAARRGAGAPPGEASLYKGVLFMTERDEQLDGVLAGTRVLDFGRYIAGPYCAALLADLGADVIRIERRGGGEDRRVAPVAADGAGALYLVMNRNKRAMTLDPACPEGREIVRKLVATADVVVANLPPEVLKSLALDLESLRRVKPDIILTTVTAFGAGGPWSHKHGFDGIGQVMCGSAYLTGTPDQPLRAAVAWVDR